MLAGAIAVMATGQFSLTAALAAINIDVMIFLFGMFVLGEALYQSGYLYTLSHRIFRRAGNVDQLILFLVFSFGLLSAVLMNDTLAVIGTPLALYLSRKLSISPPLLLLCLCFAITTGSVLSPIGNPQNLLIAVNSGLTDPFPTFLIYLGIPTLINLVLIYVLLKFFFKEEFQKRFTIYDEEPVRDPALANLSKISLLLVIGLIILQIISAQILSAPYLHLSVIALGAAFPLLIFSKKRTEIVRNIDWRTLVFFIAMFILMQSVFNTGFFQALVGVSSVSSVPVIIGTSIILSQFISNVPFVALFQPLILAAGTSPVQTMALAAGSTIAGNLMILGAASNVIVIQHAEREGENLPFLMFLKIGLPLTILNSLVYIGFLLLLS